MRTGCWGRTLLPRKRRVRINRLLRPGGSPASRSPESPFNFTEIRTAPCKASVRRRWRHLSSSRSLPRGENSDGPRVGADGQAAPGRGPRCPRTSVGVQKLKVRLESGTRGAWVLAPFPPLWERGNRQAVPQSRSERRSPAEVLR